MGMDTSPRLTLRPEPTMPPSSARAVTGLRGYRRRIQQAWNLRRLWVRFPMLSSYAARAESIRKELIEPYERYVTSVSTRLMGVSFETATLLGVLCEVLGPKRVLDLGSGFSSYVFRSYATQRPGTTVVSVDDDDHWLDRTAAYLRQNKLSTQGLISWETFGADRHEAFDLIFHDLGAMTLRAQSLAKVLDLACEKPGAVVILDDVHKRVYRPVVDNELRQRRCKWFDLAPYTRDEFGRYAMMVSDVEPRRRGGILQDVNRVPGRIATAMAPLPVIGKAVIKVRNWARRYDPVHLESGVSVVPDRLNKLWQSVAKRGYHGREADAFLAGYLRRGDTVIDAGAKVGVSTAITAKTVGATGRVHSFEVDPKNFRQLQRTVRRNGLVNVEAVQLALDQEPGPVTFNTPCQGTGGFMTPSVPEADSAEVRATPQARRALDTVFQGAFETRHTYEATSIDRYVKDRKIDRLDVIRINVDGSELAVLRGGQQALKRFGPALMVEVSMFSGDYGAGFAQLFDFLSWQGYWVYASTRGRHNVQRVTDPSQVPVDLHKEKQAIDLLCRFPGREDERWSRFWFVADPRIARAA